MAKVEKWRGEKTRSDVNNENGKMYEKMLTSRFISTFTPSHLVSTRLVCSFQFSVFSPPHFWQGCVRIRSFFAVESITSEKSDKQTNSVLPAFFLLADPRSEQLLFYF